MIARIFKHLALPDWWRRRHLSEAALARVEEAVRKAEQGHGGEIRVAVEASLDFLALLRGTTARARAVELFAGLGVWDTEDNNGVLIYVLLADRDVEIVADRGVARRLPQAEWEAICQEMEALFRAGQPEQALRVGTERVGARLAELYPGGRKAANELLDRPAMLG